MPQAGIINPGEFPPANSIEIVIWAAVGGRGGAGASVTDSDRGRLADPAGRGQGNAARYSDNDIGLAADPIGRGRRRVERRP